MNSAGRIDYKKRVKNSRGLSREFIIKSLFHVFTKNRVGTNFWRKKAMKPFQKFIWKTGQI